MDRCKVGGEDRELASKNYPISSPVKPFSSFLSLSSFFFFFSLAGSHGTEASLQLTVWLSLAGNS